MLMGAGWYVEHFRARFLRASSRRVEPRLDCDAVLRSHIERLSVWYIYKNKACLQVKFQNALVF